jgi:hypothetical protein
MTHVARFLTFADIPALLQLESRQWTLHQAADANALHTRLTVHPGLCVGVFCTRTGKALASLFMKPIARVDLQRARCWSDCAAIGYPGIARVSNSLFGISLTSVDPQATAAIFDFFWPHALKNGWREIYLGSPVPGLKCALEQDPSLDVKTYIYARRGGLPLDPQLRYYSKKGFTDIVAVLPDYFPHEASLDYGVLIRGDVPLSRHCLVWKRLPLGAIQAMLGWIVGIEHMLDKRTRTRVAQHTAL